jgi:hypothetical protein
VNQILHGFQVTGAGCHEGVITNKDLAIVGTTIGGDDPASLLSIHPFQGRKTKIADKDHFVSPFDYSFVYFVEDCLLFCHLIGLPVPFLPTKM